MRIAGIDPAHDRRLVVPQSVYVRQVGAEMQVGHPAGCAAGYAAEHHHGENGAEQAVNGAQQEAFSPRLPGRCLAGPLRPRLNRGAAASAIGRRQRLAGSEWS
jgi:hypothetical protein